MHAGIPAEPRGLGTPSGPAQARGSAPAPAPAPSPASLQARPAAASGAAGPLPAPPLPASAPEPPRAQVNRKRAPATGAEVRPGSGVAGSREAAAAAAAGARGGGGGPVKVSAWPRCARARPRPAGSLRPGPWGPAAGPPLPSRRRPHLREARVSVQEAPRFLPPRAGAQARAGSHYLPGEKFHVCGPTGLRERGPTHRPGAHPLITRRGLPAPPRGARSPGGDCSRETMARARARVDLCPRGERAGRPPARPPAPARFANADEVSWGPANLCIWQTEPSLARLK